MSEKSAEEKQNSSTVKAETSVAAEKASAFRSYLEKEKITGVQFHDVGDAVHSHVVRSHLPVQGQSLPFMVLIDDSVYTLIQVEVAAQVVDLCVESVDFGLIAHLCNGKVVRTVRVLELVNDTCIQLYE